MSAWALAKAKPLPWGGLEFVLMGPAEKRLEWWPGDSHLSHEGRPFRAAPVKSNSGKAARAAAEALVLLLNLDEEEAA